MNQNSIGIPFNRDDLNLKLDNMNQKPNIIDKLDLAILKHEIDLKHAKKERHNENLTEGQVRALHLEIEQLRFALKTLNFIKND